MLIVGCLVSGCGRLGYEAQPVFLDASTPALDAFIEPRDSGQDARAIEIDAGTEPELDAGPPPVLCGTGPWRYLQDFVVAHAEPTAMLDLQVEVVVDTRALVAEGRVDASCSNIAFHRGTTLVRHWLQRGCGTEATVFWVRIPDLPSGESGLTMSYGNAEVVSPSDGRAVFLFFDDFDDQNIDDWSLYTRNFQNGADRFVAYGTSTAHRITPPASLTLEAAASCTVEPFDGVSVGMRHAVGLPVGAYRIEFDGRADIREFLFDTWAEVGFRMEFETASASGVFVRCEGAGCTASSNWVTWVTEVDASAIPTFGIELRSSDCANSVGYFDNLRIRRRASAAPTVTIEGGELACP